MAPVNKLVSLTWLLGGAEKFSKIYITLHDVQIIHVMYSTGHLMCQWLSMLQ